MCHDERQRLVPRPIRPVLRLLRVTDFCTLLMHLDRGYHRDGVQLRPLARVSAVSKSHLAEPFSAAPLTALETVEAAQSDRLRARMYI